MSHTSIYLPEVEIPPHFIPHGRHHVESDVFYVQFEDVSVVEREQPNGLIVLYANHDRNERIVGFGIQGWSRLPKDEIRAHP